MIPPNKARFGLIVVIVLLGTIFRLASAEEKPVRLNPAALAFAQQLIEDGRVISDQKGNWRRDQPSTSRNNEFIRAHGLEEYAKWHLGIDRRHRSGSKAHYKFPFGDFNTAHRCGLLAVKARAHEYGYVEIEAAATQLLAMIESARPARQKRID
jgi:hypothetical protein